MINAGDGRHAHPTQAMLNMYTIRHYKGGFAGLRVIDASIMPADCRANTHFTTVVIGEAIARGNGCTVRTPEPPQGRRASS